MGNIDHRRGFGGLRPGALAALVVLALGGCAAEPPDSDPFVGLAAPPPKADWWGEGTPESEAYQGRIFDHLRTQLAQVRAVGARAFVDVQTYPWDRAIPQELAALAFELPFAADRWIRCQQSNNTMYYGDSGATHNPDKPLRYALDFAEGYDVAGTPVLAAASGTAYVYDGARPIAQGEDGVADGRNRDNGGFGNFVAIDHHNGFASIYAHLDRASVTTGQPVTVGDELGVVGRTGGAGVAHLHFQVVRLRRTPTPVSGLDASTFNQEYGATFGASVPFMIRVLQTSQTGAPTEVSLDSRLFNTDFYGLVARLGLPETAFYYRSLIGKPDGLPARETHHGPHDSTVLYYDGTSPDVLARLDGLLTQLGGSAPFDAVLGGTFVVVAPPGQGLTAIPELAQQAYLQSAEGVALSQGLNAEYPQPGAAVRHDSLQNWNLGIAHEWLHLLHLTGMDQADQAKIHQTWSALPGVPATSYCNEREMFAFFGQWYLSGYGDLFEEELPGLHQLLVELLGDTRIDVGTPYLTETQAEETITLLVRCFTGAASAAECGDE